jgi:hypothetical protein
MGPTPLPFFECADRRHTDACAFGEHLLREPRPSSQSSQVAAERQRFVLLSYSVFGGCHDSPQRSPIPAPPLRARVEASIPTRWQSGPVRLCLGGSEYMNW